MCTQISCSGHIGMLNVFAIRVWSFVCYINRTRIYPQRNRHEYCVNTRSSPLSSSSVCSQQSRRQIPSGVLSLFALNTQNMRLNNRTWLSPLEGWAQGVRNFIAPCPGDNISEKLSILFIGPVQSTCVRVNGKKHIFVTAGTRKEAKKLVKTLTKVAKYGACEISKRI